MVEGHVVEEDGLTWTLKLREGLRFHDKEPVLARDVVASIRRFAPRVIFTNALMDATGELSAPDDRTVQFRLKRPFPHLPEALGGPGGNAPVIMPERLAAESPFKPVAEIVGSGPYRFLKDEHVSGARAVFERFAEYQPRAGGPVGFTSGPKVANFERIEWLTLDPFSASAALRRGEIDWWENPARDLVDQVSGDPNITVVSHFATANGIMTFNQLYPPFDNPAIRRALLGAVDQAEAMSAIAGSDRSNWRDDVGLFGTGSPFASDVGIEVLRRRRDYAAAKRALTEAGYKGEKIVVPTDVSEIGNLTRTGAEQLRRAGMNLDQQEMDAGSWFRRRGNQAPPDKGGYNVYCTLIDRSLPNVHPYGQLGHSRRRQGADKRLGQQSAHRGIARHLARHGRSGAAKADLRRFAEAALDRRAVHSAWRILAGDSLPKGFDRRPARMFRDVLWRASHLNQRIRAEAYLRFQISMASPVRPTTGFGASRPLPRVRAKVP